MPFLKVIAGPNGSGKSTLAASLVQQGINFGEYLNADDIARELDGSPEWTTSRAQQIVRERRAAALAQQRDHSFETVMSHFSHIEYMQAARAAGFQVQLFFIATEDPVINLGRVAERVVRGGHDVPQDRIITRYHRCLAHLAAAIDASSDAAIFDNSNRMRPLQRLAQVRTMYLSHAEKPEELPVWWLEILRLIRPVDPLTNGPIDPILP